MTQDQLNAIDWDMTLRMAGNKAELANDMLSMLISKLPEDAALIRALYNDQKIPELAHHVHKLHGALCYCGLPRLKRVVVKLESDLKSNIMDNLVSHLDQLDLEVELLLERFTHLHHLAATASEH